MECSSLATGQPKWSHPSPGGTLDRPAVHPDGVVLSGAHLASVTAPGRSEVFPSVKLTAPAGVRGHTAYAGLRGSNGANMLVGRQLGLGQQLWVRDLPAEVAATPVATARAVYVVASRVLYRLDPKTAATCWKKTLPLGEGEVVDELTQSGDELWVSGAGFVARVRNETPLAKDDLGAPPAELTPPPPAPSSFPPAGVFGGR